MARNVYDTPAFLQAVGSSPIRQKIKRILIQDYEMWFPDDNGWKLNNMIDDIVKVFLDPKNIS